MGFVSCVAFAVSLFASSRAGVHQSTELKVCTTGDYPPLTYCTGDWQDCSGLGPKVMKEFAHQEQFDLVFVKTTWSTLNEDLNSTNCTLAAGGITKTQGRADNFLLSTDVLESKKVPIFTTATASLVDSLSDMNDSSFTLISNVGGTNEKFLKTLHQTILTKPKMKILDSNQGTYDYLENTSHEKVVFFTDSIEVEYRAYRSPNLSDKGLNFSFPPNISPVVPKVYMAKKNDDCLMGKLDAFIKAKQANGEFDEWKKEAFEANYSNAMSAHFVVFG